MYSNVNMGACSGERSGRSRAGKGNRCWRMGRGISRLGGRRGDHYTERAILGIVVALALIAMPLLEGCGGVTKVVVDQESGRVTVDGDTVDLKCGNDVSVCPSCSMRLQVVNTNTALYDITTGAEKIDSPEWEGITAFFKGLQGYLPELNRVERVPHGDVVAPFAAMEEPVPECIKGLEKRFSSLGRAFNGYVMGKTSSLAALESTLRSGMRRVYTATSYADEISGMTGLVADLQPYLTDSGLTRVHLKVADDLAALAQEVGKLARDIEAAGSTNECSDSAADDIDELAKRALELRDHLNDALATSRKLEKLAMRVITYQPTYEKTFNQGITIRSGEKLTVAIVPLDIWEQEYMARKDKTELTLNLLPGGCFSLSAGLMVMYAFGSPFAQYEARERADSSFEVAVTQRNHQQWGYGLALGLGYNPARGKFSFGIDGSFNPGDDVKQLGLGAFIAYDFVKLGQGGTWIKHKELGNGLVEGSIIETEKDLVLDDAYGDARPYLGLSVFGWPF